MRAQKSNLLILTLLGSMTSATAMADTQAPSRPNGLNVQAINDSAVRVSWNKPWDNVGVDGYNIYRNNQYYATVFNTNYIDYGVSSNSQYEYGIVAFDAARNYTHISDKKSVSVGGSNNSSSAPNSEPSQGSNVPSQLRAEILNGNQAKLFWSAPQGNIKGYNVYRDGGYVTSTSATDYTDSQMSWGQDYRYQIVAYTHNNTFSPKSAELVVNTAGNQTSAQAAPPAPAPSNDPVHSGGVPDGYRQVFADEFQQYSLDASKWNSQYRWGPWTTINNEQQFYVDRINNPDFGHSPFEFDGEHMTISAIRTPQATKRKRSLVGVLVVT